MLLKLKAAKICGQAAGWRILEYLAATQRSTSQPDYVRLLQGMNQAEVDMIFSKISSLANNRGNLESAFRKVTRRVFVEKMEQWYPNDAQRYAALDKFLRNTGTNAQGQVFETWGRSFLDAPPNAKKKIGSKQIKTGNQKFVPDEIIILNTDPPSIHIREYKYFVKSGDLPEYDKPKIEAYEQIVANHGTVELEGKNYSIAKVEYIFSNKGAFDENQELFGSDKKVSPHYIDKGQLK